MKAKPTTKKNVLIIGGGTGTHTVLRGLKRYTDSINLKAIVTMADSGGSTGRLRDEFGFLPVGDARMALVALARDGGEYDHILRKLFLYRFHKGNGLSGHTFGNLLLVALTDILGSEESAIHAASTILASSGEVIPVTADKVNLKAVYDDGRVVVGEHEIDIGLGSETGSKIQHISLEPAARPNARALAAIAEADLIVLGPGDLYTSILAACIVDGVAYALRHTRAHIAYVSNLMTRNAQTNTMGTREHVAELGRYIGRSPNSVLVNTAPFREDLIALYREENEHPVTHNLTDSSLNIITGDFLASENIVREKGDVVRRSLIRHDPEKLARGIMRLI